MTIAPLLVVIIIAVIVTLAFGCFFFAIAWNRADHEIALLRKQCAFRAIGSVSSEEPRNG